jgi:hypothetical protein
MGPARSIYGKSSSFTNAMVFEIASTNLVLELGVISIILRGWQFAATKFEGRSQGEFKEGTSTRVVASWPMSAREELPVAITWATSAKRDSICIKIARM